MLNAIKKIPSGTFLVPMVISMLLISFFPNMYDVVGGTTQQTFQQATGAIIGFMIFASGTSIDLKQIGPILKRHGVFLLFKLVWSLLLAWLYVRFFGLDGIWGISALAFVCTIISLNPAVALAVQNDYGDKNWGAVYGLYGLFCLPFIPVIFFSLMFSSEGGIDWMPIISIFIPLIAGIILGNIDKGFATLFGPLIPGLLPFLGWNLGTSMNIFSALEAGIPGLIMTLIFMVAMIPLYWVDRVQGYDGINGIGSMNVAGMSVAVPAAVIQAVPQLAPYEENAVAILVTTSLITSIITPFMAKARYEKVYPEGQQQN